MIRTLLVRGFGVPLLLCALGSGCAVQFVSPYSADVQKRASDMISEVSAWEVQMRVSAGTPQADPRHPDMTATFARWNGEVEAMAATEAALDPHVIACDKVAAIVARGSSSWSPSRLHRRLLPGLRRVRLRADRRRVALPRYSRTSRARWQSCNKWLNSIASCPG